MRLKHLQLQGYKTFALKTEFSFPSGITAIVGPNGSGKSNIADAIRWVLGEQSYSTLRGKRTEDMIFSGSQSRPRAGMAEANLTLDNSDGWLPVDFSEVTIGRRAYRDGQNEYLLNGSRVRLKDVTELLSQSGLSRRTYTVIGQGLVDAVLSLRPSERRELFEEAAGIAHYQAKREDALSKLEETARNLERVEDILAEIKPRLKRLEGQAERAREHEALSAHLERLLRTWYGYRWDQATTALKQAREIVRHRADFHKLRLQNLQKLSDRIDRSRHTQSELRQQLGEWHRQGSSLHARAEAGQRELAVLAERRRQLSTQKEEQLAEIATLEARLQAQAERVARARSDLEAAEQVLAEREGDAQAAQAALEARRADRESRLQARNAAAERQAALRAQIAERQAQQKALMEEAAALAAQIKAREAEMAQSRAELEAQAGEIGRIDARITQLEGRLEAARRAHAELESRRQTLLERMEEGQAALRQAREREAEVAARLDLLSQLRRDFSVYGEATRALLAADLPGVRGVLARLIQLPAERPALATAVEAALGAYAGAVVVTDWQAARAALDHLRSVDAPGRAVVLALKSPSSAAQPPTAGAQDTRPPGTPLSTQVRCEAGLRPLVARLLGRAYLVPDLEAAAAALPHLPAGALCVTPGGELLRGDGALEGGRRGEQSSPLAQEQAWARLSEQRVELGARRERLEAHVAQSNAALEELQRRLTQRQVALDELEARRISERAIREQAMRRVDRVEQTLHWQRDRLANAQAEERATQTRGARLGEEITALTATQRRVAAEIQTLTTELEQLPAHELDEALSAAQLAVGAARQTRQSQERILHEMQAGLGRLEQERENRERRAAELTDKEQAAAGRSAQLAGEQTEVAAALAALAAQIEPAEQELERLERELQEAQEQERRERARLREFENHLTHGRLDVQRREDELERLRSRIEEDLGLVELELDSGMRTVQTPLPLRPLVSRLPVVRQLPDGLEEEIKWLRAQLHRLGGVNPNAQADYEEALERHNFLQSQSADLIAGGDALRQVIAEMDGLIEHAFRQTFEAVAAEFAAAFTTLFGGGQARLELTDPDDLTHSGVDIVAQPPGKRLQTLASLSGGERSLTAVGLIFSILRVSPTPFCILDEVDAMLDEANVSRFRRMLEALARHTQIVIITHNRGTITAADTIYGISMGSDSVSQVYSLRMDGEQIQEL